MTVAARTIERLDEIHPWARRTTAVLASTVAFLIAIQTVWGPTAGVVLQGVVIGAITFHFSSGDLGEALLGESIFSASAVERRRREVSEFIRRGLVA